MKLEYAQPDDMTGYKTGRYRAVVKSVTKGSLKDKEGNVAEKLKWVLDMTASDDPFAEDGLSNIDLNYYTGFKYGNASANLTKIVDALCNGPVSPEKLPDTDKFIGRPLIVVIKGPEKPGEYPKILDLEALPKGG